MSHSPYRGVLWHSRDGHYRVRIRCTRGRRVELKTYQDPKVAARVYDVAARLLHGPNAVLNFDGQPPDEVSEPEIRKLLQDRGVLDPNTGAPVL